MLAVIVPDEEYLQMWAGQQGMKGDMGELCANEVGRTADAHAYTRTVLLCVYCRW